MARIDFKDESLNRFSVWHHRFDSDTNHFRWFLVDCFDSEREMKNLLADKWSELNSRKLSEVVSPKEQYVGRIRKMSRNRFRFFAK
jgi:hypothetical protein